MRIWPQANAEAEDNEFGLNVTRISAGHFGATSNVFTDIDGDFPPPPSPPPHQKAAAQEPLAGVRMLRQGNTEKVIKGINFTPNVP